MESQYKRSREILELLRDVGLLRSETSIVATIGVQGKTRCFAPIAIFLEHDGKIVIKQATATLVEVPPFIRVAEEVWKKDIMFKDDAKDRQRDEMETVMRQTAIFPASSIKVPVRGLKATFYKVRAVVLFSEDDQKHLVNSWLLGRVPTAAAGSDGYLVEGVHYQVCPGYNYMKSERKHNDFAVIALMSKTNLRPSQPADVFNCFEGTLHCIRMATGASEGNAEYEAFANRLSTVSKYDVSGYTLADVGATKDHAWEVHVRDLANGSHPLYQRERLEVSLKARHLWESQTDAHPWKMPEEERQYKKPTKRILPTFNAFWHNCRALFQREQRRTHKFRWRTLPVLLRTPIHVDWDLMLAQGLDTASNASLDANTVMKLTSGAMNGGVWTPNPKVGPLIIGMHLGGAPVPDPSSTDNTGGLYVALALQHRFVKVVSLLLADMLIKVYKIGFKVHEAMREKMRRLAELAAEKSSRESENQASASM